MDLSRLRGIEIGPLISPLVSKQVSEVYYVDHADRETLQKKYASDPNVDTEKIVSIDAVWGERTLRECFPGREEFDYVVASHVIEHVPDMLGWLCEIAEVLRPGGRLMLAVPDRRFTFDYLRQTSRTSEVIDAYLRKIRRPMPAQLFDYNVNAVEVDMAVAWEGGLDPASLKHYVNPRYAFDRSVESVRDTRYIDAHCWVFTAGSLAALCVELVDLDLLPYRCVQFYEPERNTNEISLVLERLTGPSDYQKAEARESFMTHLRRFERLENGQNQDSNRALEQARAEIAGLTSRINALESEIALLRSRRFPSLFALFRQFRRLSR